MSIAVHHSINYVEFPASDFDVVETFYSRVFKWTFTDYGPDYRAFKGDGLEGGFYKSEKQSKASDGAALIVFYSDNLEDSLAKVTEHGGRISVDIFSFPGGRRFQFFDPAGNELAIWSET
jgi:predicted enzyme related to lactoylglutathione lyase